MTADRGDILDILRETVADQLAVDASGLTRETSLTGDLGVDSLDLLQLTCAIEYRFSLTLADGDLADARTLGDVVDTIAALSGRKDG